MSRTNEFGAELFLSALAKYEEGGKNVRAAMIDAAKGFADMHKAIVKSNDGKAPKGKAYKSALDKKLETRGPVKVTANIVGSWLGHRNYRAALLWMHENPKQVQWVFDNTEVSNPLSAMQAWTNHFRKTVKEANDEEGGRPDAGEVSSAITLPGVKRKDIEAEYKRLDEAAAQREKREAEKAEAGAVEAAKAEARGDAPEAEVSAIKVAIDNADAEELLLLEALIQKRRKALGMVKPEAPVGEYKTIDRDQVKEMWMDGTPIYVGKDTPVVKVLEHTDGTVMAINLETKEEITRKISGELSATKALNVAKHVAKLPAKVGDAGWWA